MNNKKEMKKKKIDYFEKQELIKRERKIHSWDKQEVIVKWKHKN